MTAHDTCPSPAKPARLRSGEWGARVGTEDVGRGDVLVITTRAGKSWEAEVSRVVWSGDGQALVETRSLDAKPAKKKSRRAHSSGRCSDCGIKLETWHDGYSMGLCHDCL